MPTPRRRRAVRSAQAVTGVFVVGYFLSTVFRAQHASSSLYDGWIGNIGYTGCALLCAWRAVAVRRQRWAWASIALSLALFTVGAVLWTWFVQFWTSASSPTIADIFFLVFYPVAYLGVGLLVRDTLPKGSRAIWFDGLIAALGVSAIEASLVIAPISHGTKGDPATVATNLAYPIGDLVLVAMLVAVFAMRGWRPGRLWWTLGAGLVIFAVADSVYVLRVTANTYTTGTPLDSLWLIGTFLIAIAAWQTSSPRRQQARQNQPVVIPVLFLLSSLGIVLLGGWRDVLPLAVFFGSCTLLVAFGRMGYAYRQLRALAESRREARTDELTGLPNRRHFYELLRGALDSEKGQALAVLMIDLDRFKEINDSLGHQVGDDVLRQLGPRLASVVGGAGTVARLGGDEFGLLLSTPLGESAATDLADDVCRALEQPFALENMSLRIDASIGIALAPEHGAAADVLLQKADVAMYEAKKQGRTWEIYSAARDMHTRERLELLEDLRDAIDRGELQLHYQPKVDLSSGCTTGYEALVRWHHPTRGLLPPDRFLGLAEQSGLMDKLAMAVLDGALSQQARWARAGHEVTVAVNLSAANLRDDELPAKVAAALARHHVAAAQLVLEITEDQLMADAEQGRRILTELRAFGVQLSIDDYGTGFSSLAYLRELPVNELKLDRMFLAGVPGDRRAESIIRSTIELAHSLGLRMVAEGIESDDVLALIAGLGCDTAQGYLLGRPAPAAEFFREVSPRFEGRPVEPPLVAAPSFELAGE